MLRTRRSVSAVLFAVLSLAFLYFHTSGSESFAGGLTFSGDYTLWGGSNDSECNGFDPATPELDPPNCLRARQYRQVEAVLEREKKGEHSHWYFTRKYNIETLTNLLQCFATYPSPCPPKPLIISGWWYTAGVTNGGTSGETIWQRGLQEQLTAINMSLIAVGPYSNWVVVAEMMPDVYRLIWNSDIDTVSCVTDPRCVAQYTPPEGGEDLSIGVPEEERGIIPIWSLNVVDYWGCQPNEVSHNDYWWGLTENGEWSYQPLGQEWIATPWPVPGGHVHLPYSMERECMQLPYKTFEERNDTVLIFAKRSSYFTAPWATPKEYFSKLSQDPSFELLSTAEVEEGQPMPEGVRTIGVQKRHAYDELISSVKVLLGIGAPHISPSVYAALCQGTPVIVPHKVEKPNTSGWNLYQISMQHGPAMMIGEPYVYNYWAENYTELEAVVHRAVKTPIERYIPADMKWDYAIEQMTNYVNRDLEAMYREKVKENGGELPRLIKGPREKCYELGRCAKVIPAGRVPLTPPYALLPKDEQK